jgi:hypothetical protein
MHQQENRNLVEDYVLERSQIARPKTTLDVAKLMSQGTQADFGYSDRSLTFRPHSKFTDPSSLRPVTKNTVTLPLTFE